MFTENDITISPEDQKAVEQRIAAEHTGKSPEEIKALVDANIAATKTSFLSEINAFHAKALELTNDEKYKGKSAFEIAIALAEEAESASGSSGGNDDADSFFGRKKPEAGAGAGSPQSDEAIVKHPKYIELQRSLSDLQQVVTDPFMVEFVKAKSAGGPQDFLSFIQSSAIGVNYDTMTPAQLYQASLEQTKKEFNISDESIKNKMAEFAKLDEVDQAQRVIDIKSRLKTSQSEAIKKYVGEQGSKYVNPAERLEQHATSLVDTFNPVKGKKVMGVTIDDQFLKEARNYIIAAGGGFLNDQDFQNALVMVLRGNEVYNAARATGQPGAAADRKRSRPGFLFRGSAGGGGSSTNEEYQRWKKQQDEERAKAEEKRLAEENARITRK